MHQRRSYGRSSFPRCDTLIAQEAKKMSSSGHKPIEYRCSRCRWSSSGAGCATKYCNPHKWKAWVEKCIADCEAAKAAEAEAVDADALEATRKATAIAEKKAAPGDGAGYEGRR